MIDMHAILIVNDENTSLESFIYPEMKLSSALSEIVKNGVWV
jgi:hypothetical protein